MRRLSIFCVLALAPVWAWALPEPGLWRPADGELGARPVAALARGGDGALYAAGAGRLHRRAPGQAWLPVGTYAPSLTWDEGHSVEAAGPFPPVWLNRVSEDALRSLEAVAGPAFESGEVSEDVARQLLRAYVEEVDAPVDSPYRVVRMLPAIDGVWLATGAALFRVDKSGVRGPVGAFEGIRDLATLNGSLWVATERALWSLASDGIPVQRRLGAVDALVSTSAGLVFLSEGALWTWPLDGEPAMTETPTGIPSALAARGDAIWAATALALYRWAAGEWRLCPPLPDAITRMVPAEDGVVLVGESRLLFVDAECGAYVRQPRPWPGDARVLDAVSAGDELWLATVEGLFLHVPHSHAMADAARLGAFRRALRDLPSLDQITGAAMRYQGLDRASRSFGWRPAIRGVLPTVSARYVSNWRRNEDVVRGRPLLVEVLPPRPQWRLMAEWTINFDVLGLLFDVERAPLTSQAAVDTQALIAEDATTDEAGASDTADDAEALPGLETVASDAAFMLIAAERRQSELDRQRLIRHLATLYRERMRLMFRLWAEVDPDALPLKDALRLHEIDADFDALTGGEFTRLVSAASTGTLTAAPQ